MLFNVFTETAHGSRCIPATFDVLDLSRAAVAFGRKFQRFLTDDQRFPAERWLRLECFGLHKAAWVN